MFRTTRSLFDRIRSALGRSTGARRYEFQREQAGVWTLCFDPTAGTWQVEQVGTGGEPLRFTISAFEVGLLRRGYSADDIKKIWGGNFLRVFREAERAAKSYNVPK